MFKNSIKKVLTLILTITISSMIMIGCTNEKTSSDTIKIATKPMSEQFIISEMLKLLIEENTDLNVEITKGIGGGTSNIHPALLDGEFDLYPEYTGTAWNFILSKESIPDEDTLYKELCEEYENEYNLKWSGLYGFNNTFGLAIRKDIADKYNIKTYSDLAEYSSELVFGAEYDFYERDDGYDALCGTYDFKFKEATDLDIGLKYEAINSKQVDVINVATTDGQISISDVVVLEDDKSFYKNYYCGTVVRMDVLEKHPELENILSKMDDLISAKEIAELNYRLEGNHESEEDLAEEFLQKKGLIK